MPIFFAVLKNNFEKYYFEDRVLNISCSFPKLPILEDGRNYIFVFSNSFFHEADHVLKKKEDNFELDGEGSYELPSYVKKYFVREVEEIFFFLEPVKE